MIRRWQVQVGGAARKHPFLLALVVMTAVSVAGFVRVQHVADERQRDQVCVASWADQYTARAERISKLNATTATALAENIRALNVVLGDAIRQDDAAVARDIPAYQKAAAAYKDAAQASKDAVKSDPIPDAPKFQCR